ncbi:MAG: RNA-binding protein [Verrucomicrobium sp.]|nr:RNA-binding protein [Verrucomicrobium sp.]
MKLYVGNISYQTTESDLRDLFAPYGNVNEVAVVMDRDTMRPRGFAFVTMGNAEAGQAAVTALNGKAVGGRNLTVNEARPMESRSRRF